ncbi:Uncharacterised protein [Mycobacteroides abscessus]|nr:Uncharacterised protein [Mycobacteroides abscessus]
MFHWNLDLVFQFTVRIYMQIKNFILAQGIIANCMNIPCFGINMRMSCEWQILFIFKKMMSFGFQLTIDFNWISTRFN